MKTREQLTAERKAIDAQHPGGQMKEYDLTPAEKQALCDAVLEPVNMFRKYIKREFAGQPLLTTMLDVLLEKTAHEQWANVEKVLGERML